jgi:uncharacterized protein YbjT (DUF2867 family)
MDSSIALMTPSEVAPEPRATILLTGATGFIGGRLLHRLEQAVFGVRCLTRRPQALAGRVGSATDVVVGDVLDRESLAAAMVGVDTAYYLVHSMGTSDDFEDVDRRAASNFAEISREAGVRRVVYLGGLGSGDDLSAHLASRHEVGDILRGSGPPTIELRASIVIGSGSASFETVRALVEHLPAIPGPRWLETATEPIAIEDVIDYLFAALSLPGTDSAIIEIGGGDRVTYAEVMREYARQRKLRRRVIPMPLMSLGASRLLLGVLTPVYGQIARDMVESLRNETVVHSGAARAAFPIKPRGLSESIERALINEDHDFVEARWSESLATSRDCAWGGVAVGRRRVTSDVAQVREPVEEAFAPIQRIGGPTGWYGVDWFWRLRGSLDRLRGGEGQRRGRRDPHDLQVGDKIDFWRVERFEPGRRLLLAAEMKLPGRLWLQFDLQADDEGTQIRQSTVFDPAGYVGLLYWYLLYPVHHRIFGSMLRGLRNAIRTGQQSSDVRSHDVADDELLPAELPAWEEAGRLDRVRLPRLRSAASRPSAHGSTASTTTHG